MIENQDFTYIGKGTNLKGSFSFNGPTHFQGQIDGDIAVIENAKITLEIGSLTTGTLDCFDIDIYGTFIGEIKSKGLITIYPTAIYEGKIFAKSLEILPGAVVNMNGHTEE